jgi:ABC-type antimicrobial peptide transport system permease subunit
MLRNYFTVAVRSILRNKFHTSINVIGLAIGISACLVIYLIVSYELSFNKGIQGYDNIFRIHSKFTGTFSGLNRGAPTASAPYIRDNFTGIDKVTMFICFRSKVQVPSASEKKDLEEQEAVALTSPDYFDVIDSYEWLVGSPQVLDKPYQVVLTQQQLKNYFGDITPQSAIGKEIIYRDSLITNVAGVVADLSFPTDFEFTDFISFATIEASWLKKNYQLDDWPSTNSSTQVFIKALPETNHAQLMAQLPQLTRIYKEKSTWDAVNNFDVQPLSDLHYNNETGIFDFSRAPAHMPTLITLILVAVLLLAIAAINFINLATANAVRRAKVVGVRKVLGSSRGRLVLQFLCEGLMVTVVAVMLSLPLTEISLSYFSDFVPKGVTLNVVQIIPFLVLTIITLGVLASAYPAWALSSFLPVLALKNQAYVNSSQSRTAFLRKSLIVFQFAFAQVLIFGTVVVSRQIHFMINKDLGFRKDAVIYFYTPWFEKHEKTIQLKNEIESLPEVAAISLSDDAPSSNGWSSNTLSYSNETEEIKVNSFRKNGDTLYLRFYNIPLLAGRNLAHSDTVKEFLINEELMHRLGFTKPEDAIGEEVTYNKKKIPIIGVFRDFHMKSLHEKIEPVMIANEMNEFTCLNIRLNNNEGESLQTGIEKIQTAWKKIYPDVPLDYHFLDETIRNYYRSEQRISKLISTATGLAIFISCLGLFGLASYMATQRTKEIGIRKVLGASVQQVVTLLSKEFLVLIVIAFIIALPVAWYSAHLWLESFPYRASVAIWMFVATAMAAIGVAMITVGYQTMKAANLNPVESLRNE